MAFHFPIEETLQAVLSGVLEAAGENFTPPFDSDSQPINGVAVNADPFAYIQLPAGASLQGMANPGVISSISDSINSVVAAMAPFTSAYMMLMPIFGIIKGIIEVICALMNPFAVVKAVVKLFTKYIIPFIALFPPFAGLLLLIGVLKIILAIVLFIITIVIPLISLIINNIKELVSFIDNAFNKSKTKKPDKVTTPILQEMSADLSSDFTLDKVNGVKKKVAWLLAELIKQCGIIEIIQPILEMVLQILKLSVGIPCKKKKKGGDSDCCEEDVCPEVFSTPPSGIGKLKTSKFGHMKRGVFKLITGNERVRLLEPYQSNLEEQLNNQLDDKIRTSNSPPGFSNKTAFNVRLSDRRGSGSEIVVPVLDISGTTLKIKSKAIYSLMGPLNHMFGGKISYTSSFVNYVIEPNYEYMIRENIIGLGCHPEVDAAKNLLDYDMTPPNTIGILEEYLNLKNNFKQLTDNLREELNKIPEHDLDKISSIQNEMVDLMISAANVLKNRIRDLLKSAVNSSISTVEVDKKSVKANAKDKAIVTITPKDISSASIAKNLPSDIQLEVDIFTTFGTLSNKIINIATGTITAELTSPQPGNATITARINDAFISDNISGVLVPRKINVSFIADAVLPARRKKSKTSGSGMNSEYGPRK